MSTVTELHVNGEKKAIEADDGRMLLNVLRDDLGLTGCKYGCGEGKCGACTVLIDGQSTRSCMTRLSSASPASRSARSRGSSTGIGCIQFSKPSSTAARCSAATARRA